MSGGTSGFHNAPFTRAVVFACAVTTVLFGVQGRSSTIGLSYQDVFKNFYLWKLFASILGFSSTPELVFGLCLLYYFRVFERQIGSNKYSVFAIFSVTVSSLFQIITLSVLKDPNLSTLASGPYGVIFASFVPFYFDIPVSSRFRIFGVQLTDKSFVYLAGAQLLLFSWKHSLLPGLCGIIAGAIYRFNLFGIRRIKFPKSVASFFSRLTLSSGATPPASGRSIVGSIPSHSNRRTEVSQPSAPISDPPEESIAMLVSMGFDTNAARQALMQARNDLNAATNILLEAHSH
ncbi:ubiquitin-associated (UBA) protein [Wolffia australiana]